MRICLVHEEYPEETNFGGIATYQKTVAEEFAKNGNEVYVICRGLKEDQEYIENGVNIYRVYVEKTTNQKRDYINYRKKVAKILEHLQQNRLIDIIEAPDWGAETIYFESKRKVPLIVRLHTPLKVWLQYNQNNFGKVTKTMLKWERKMLLSADYITCCSQALKDIIIKSFPIDSFNIHVTPNPANIVNFYRDETIKKKNQLLYVGSLEERKGVCILAKSLNLVFHKYPELQILFVGKDTTRNNRNISTKQYILETVDKQFHKNIFFKGYIPNSQLNEYFNESLVGIFPSLFDNFPYVVLESMATGLHIIGSQNSGMVEMLQDSSSIYKTGDEIDLANKIIEKYTYALENPINYQNIKRVKEEYSASKICNQLLQIYQNVLMKYYADEINKHQLNMVLQKSVKEKVKSFSIENSGVANKVYRVQTDKNTYIIKKYLHNYDFELANQLYDVYEKSNIPTIRPINDKPIEYSYFLYNIFPYKKVEKKETNLDFLIRLVCCTRCNYPLVDKKEAIVYNKVNKYFTYLQKLSEAEYKLPSNEITYVLNQYNFLMQNTCFDDKNYINHGDITNSNIIYSNKQYYIIDFDETCYSIQLYDVAVTIIKNFIKDNTLDIENYTEFKNQILLQMPEYTELDIKHAIQFYLCKILLEKYYLYQNDIIDLFSKVQKRDYYKKYLMLLQTVDAWKL